MNNMFEYMTGGQCYKCGGKVRYPDGGESQPSFDDMQMAQMQQQPQQQQMRAPSTMDANAEQLLQFLTKQLSKGTSERILKKTLTDSGLKAEEADQLLQIAKEEFEKRFEQGDYPDPKEQMMLQQQAQAQQMAAAQQMSGGQNPDPNAQEDASMINMTQNFDQSQTADDEMAQQQARYGGSMRKIRRMNYGGNTCPEGYNWDDTMGSCVPSAITRNATQGATMNMAQPQQQQQQQSYTPDYNAIMQNDAAQRAAKNNVYDRMMGAYDANLANSKQQFNNAMGVFANKIQAGKAQGMNALEALSMGKFGGLKKFGAGGTEDGCPIGYYKAPDGSCQKIFGSQNSQSEYQNYVNFYNSTPVEQGYSRAPQQSFEEWSKENPAQDKMAQENQQYNQTVGRQKEYQKYVDWYNQDPVQEGYARAPQQSFADWEKENYPGAEPAANPTDPKAPVDPRISGDPYMVYTDKNKIANIDNNWANRAMAVTNVLGGDPRSAAAMLPNEGFGSGLKFLLGMGAAASGFGLGLQKFTSGDQSRVYDDKGNAFVYENKRDEKNALSGKSTLVPAKDPSAPSTTVPAPNERTVAGMSPEIGRGQYLQTNVDEKSQTSRGINRKGQLVSYQPEMTDQQKAFVKTYADDPEQQRKIQQQIESGDLEIQRQGGEWNPFVFEQRKLVKIPVPLYPLGGETSPYSFAEWAQQVGYDQDDIKLPNVSQEYQQYVAGFGQGSNNPNPAPSNTGQQNSTNNTTTTNPVQSNAPGTVNTAEYTVQQGDDLGWQVASNIYGGLSNATDVAEGWARKKQQRDLKNRRRQSGNSMDFAAINPVNPYGSMYAPNAGPGANQALATQGYTFDLGTTMSTSKFGGTKKYEKGGVYMLSKSDLARFIQMGGEVEFLD
jgi:hypothetical protein